VNKYQAKPPSCDGCLWKDVTVGYAAGSGPTNAKLVVVAESLGENEAIQGIPLVGATGKQLNQFLKNHGVSRNDVYCDNIVRCKPPPSSTLTRKTDKLPKEIVQFCTERHLKLALNFIKPHCIVALGDYSLNYLTGKKGISKWRGSVLPTQFGKVVPTWHPAWLHKGESAIIMEPFLDFDIGKAVEESEAAAYTPPHEDFNIAPTLSEIKKLAEHSRQEGPISVDIETSGGSWWNTAPLCLGFYFSKSNRAICVPFLSKGGVEIWSRNDLDAIVAVIYETLADEAIEKQFQNGMYNIIVLESMGFAVNNFAFDTMIAHHAIIAEKGVPHDLAFIGSIYTPFPYYKDDVKGEDNFALLEDNVLRTYNCRDVAVTAVAAREMEPEIDEYGVRETFGKDMKLQRPLINIQRRGVLVDKNLLEAYRKEADEQLAECETSLRSILGPDFNVRSTKQLRKLLFEDMKLEPISRTRTQEPAVDFDSLMQLSDQVTDDLEPLFAEIIKYRKVDKLRSTYLTEFILDSNSRVHTQYTLHVTPTGRLSSRNPNLQNFPKKRIRDIFIARLGYVLLGRDYSQIELRIFALISHDEPLLKIFREGGDVHASNASDLFGVTISAVTEEMRDFAKTFMYGAILYGGTAATIRRQAQSRALRGGIARVPSVAEIERLQFAFLSKHPNIVHFQKEIEKEVISKRRLREPFGRVRYFLGRKDSIVRAAYNFPIQGGAASIINDALIRLDNSLGKHLGGVVLQVHDELVLEVPENAVNDYVELTKEVMEFPVVIEGQSVVFPTDCEIGKSWGKMEKIK